MNAKFPYPHYSVEGRIFSGSDIDRAYHLALHFARGMANRTGRPVHMLSAPDSWTPAYVLFTATPEPEAD